MPPAPPPINPDARAARRAEERGSGRGRTGWIVVAGIVVLVVIGGGLAVALGGDDSKDAPKLDTSTNVDLTVGDLLVENVAPVRNVQITPEVSDAILATIGSYVDDGMVVPLRKGKAVDAKLATIFDQAAIARLAGTDRTLLLDEGFPKAVGRIDVTTPPVAMTGLADSEGKLLLVTATIDLAVEARAKRGVMTIQRTGSLVFIQQGDGSWLITGWTLHVERGGPGVATAPTTVPTTATTVPG
jgi:hypothetical protein